jgi:hypothetical protein
MSCDWDIICAPVNMRVLIVDFAMVGFTILSEYTIAVQSIAHTKAEQKNMKSFFDTWWK